MLKEFLNRARKDGLAEPPQDVDDHDQNLQGLQPKFINHQENPDDQPQELGAGLGANREDQEQHEDPIPNAERDIFNTVSVSKKRRTRKRKRRSFEGFYLPFVSNNNTRITGPFEDERRQEEASSSEREDPTWTPSSDEENDNIESNGNSDEQNEIEEDESEQGEEEGNHEDELEDEDDQEDEENSSDEHGSDPSWSPSDQSDDNDDY